MAWLVLVMPAAAERINQEGRILGAMPIVTNAILFNTTNADAILSAMQILPVTNPWNQNISNQPVLTNSDAMIGQIGADLSASRQKLFLFQEMNYVLAPDSQPLAPFDFLLYTNQSDFNGGTSPFGLYPIPTNMPIEGWPTQTGTQTLSQWQTNNDGSDRHSIIVQPGAGLTWETWNAVRVGTNWQAANGAIFNLNTNALRPAGWTSGDAAGFPMFPALVRYDECERGMVEHACRLVVKRTLYNTNIYPATHFAAPSANTNVNLPQMGQRLRLKAGYVIPANWTKEEKALLLGLKKYGAMVADNGNFFSISITPDDRWPANAFSYSGPPPVVQWKLYAGPGPVAFGDATQTNTTATFSIPGVYTLELSADDGVHAVAYDTVALLVTNAITVGIAPAGANVNLTWSGGSPPFVLQRADTLPAAAWAGVLTTSVRTASVPGTNTTGFFRVQGQ
jgi:hypothetical protein